MSACDKLSVQIGVIFCCIVFFSSYSDTRALLLCVRRQRQMCLTDRYTAELLEAIQEAEQIAHDPSVPSYKNWEELERALENEHAV